MIFKLILTREKTFTIPVSVCYMMIMFFYHGKIGRKTVTRPGACLLML